MVTSLIGRLSRLAAICLFLPLLAFAPTAATARTPIVKGVALLDPSHREDLAALDAPQNYGWGEYCKGAANCINMVRSWQLPKSCYPQLLAGNEPTNPEPAGYPITPTLAVSRTLAIAAKCPGTQLIVANIHVNNGSGSAELAWLAAFYAEYQALAGHEYGAVAHASGLYDAIGLHCYSLQASVCTSRLANAIALPAYHGQIWLTEWHVYGDQYGSGSGHEFADMLAWTQAQLRIDRSYIWTNRGSGTLMDLVSATGQLSAQGAQYRDWRP